VQQRHIWPLTHAYVMHVTGMSTVKQIVHHTSRTESDSTIEVAPHRLKHHAVSRDVHRLLSIMSEGNGLSNWKEVLLRRYAEWSVFVFHMEILDSHEYSTLCSFCLLFFLSDINRLCRNCTTRRSETHRRGQSDVFVFLQLRQSTPHFSPLRSDSNSFIIFSIILCLLLQLSLFPDSSSVVSNSNITTVNNFLDCGFVAPYHKILAYTYTQLHPPSR
jgi:hypothetical protein